MNHHNISISNLQILLILYFSRKESTNKTAKSEFFLEDQ